MGEHFGREKSGIKDAVRRRAQILIRPRVTSVRAPRRYDAPMSEKLRRLFMQHPLLRDALLWALPALLVGTVLRVLMLSYLPFAYWGSDSRSYFSFAHKLLTEGYISLDEKRRFLYPLLMAFVGALPGPPLKWLAVLQHALGIATLVPLAYLLRKTLAHWRVLIVPITILYAGWPIVLWYEHELLGETLVFAALVWAFAGWCAWVEEPRLARAQRLFWFFFVPFAVAILTKPSSRFLWPGVMLGLVIVCAWRRLSRANVIALGLLVVITLFVGSKKQGAWLLYVATFPLTQIDSPAHADYKAEIRDDVRKFHARVHSYYLEDDWPFAFLESPRKQEQRKLWAELDKDEKRKAKLYTDLALEGMKAEPLLFLYIGAQKLVGSVNVSEFKEDRFTSAFYIERFPHHYEDAQKKPNSPARFALGFGKRDTLPDYAAFTQQLAPRPGSWMERAVTGWVAFVDRIADFVVLPQDWDVADRHIGKTRVKPLGWWLLAACVLAVALPAYRRTFGVWTLIAVSYVCGVFLVSQINPRYFAPAWPVLLPLLAVPADAILRVVRRKAG